MSLRSKLVAFAGLWYLTLWLCAKFRVVPPSAWSVSSPRENQLQGEAGEPLLLQNDNRATRPGSSTCQDATAPPAYLLPVAYIPFGVAIFIAGTRYFDFRNHGFDVLSGAAVGTLTAWFGFRLYHPPLSSQSIVPFAPRTG